MKIPDLIIEASRSLRKNMTNAEIELWKSLKDEQIGIKFLRQKPLYVYTEDNGQDRYIIADFYSPELKIAIEVDGSIHEHKEVMDLDREKEKLLRKRGIHVIRINNGEVVSDVGSVISKIKQEIQLFPSFEGKYPKGDGIYSQIKTFLDTKTDLPKLVVIYGPTACGKTSLSIDVAKQLDSEVISTDSRQIYTGMDIGTGKITPEEMQGIRHHMLDIITPEERYSTGEFKKNAEAIISQMHNNGKIPVLCGGTGLYIDSIIYGFNIGGIPGDQELRNKLEAEAEEYGNQYVYDTLVEIDPEYAAELHPNNLQYVIRGIEVKLISGKSKRDLQQDKKLQYDVLFLTPYSGDRETLYSNINTRVAMMFDEGLVDEVKSLIQQYGKETSGLGTIGYTEVVDYLDEKITLEECIALVQQHNRNYAKRQLTWFKKYEG